MAKAIKKDKIDCSSLADITKEFGGEMLCDTAVSAYCVDSGNLALNYMFSGKFIAGGFPGGRIIEAFGPEASGKSLLGYCFMGGIQRMGGIAIWLDCERSGNAEFAENCGHVDSKKLPTFWPITLEQVEKKITAVVGMIRKKWPDKPIGLVWDSIGVNPTDREFNEIGLSENPTPAEIKAAGGNERPGERAKVSNAVLRKLNPFLSDNNATLYVINQVRKKIGVMMGDPECTAGGGEALKFYASLRIRCNAPKEFVCKKTGQALGVNMSIKNRKNRATRPGLKITNIPLFFNHGINPLGGLLEALVLAGRVSGKTNYVINPLYSNGEEATFTAALCNPLKPEVLYKYPALVDATSADEVKAYLSEWDKSVETLDNDSVQLVDPGTEINIFGTEEEEE